MDVRDEADLESQPEAPTISVVVPTYNRASHLKRVLSSFDELRAPLPVEVIVVDGTSTDGSEKVLADWENSNHHFLHKVLVQAPGRGPGDARNMGLRWARGTIVAFTDSDCIVSRDWLGNLIGPLDAGARIVGVGGAVRPYGADVFSRYYTYHRILEPPIALDYLVTANCCYLREPALAHGGFATDILRPGGEDVALSVRLKHAGYRFAFSPDSVVWHDYRSNLLDFMITFRNYGQGCRLATSELKQGGE